MTRAIVKINGVDGSNDNLPINTLVQLDNDGNGGELTYLWAFLDKPEGSLAVLSSTSIHNPTFTPDVEGTYLLSLIVNQNLPDESDATAIAAVRQLRTGQRVPAAGETTQDAATGWKLAVNRLLQLTDQIKADGNVLVCQSYVGAALGDVVAFTNVATINTGLPGAFTVPTIAKAATTQHQSLGIIVGVPAGGSPSNTLVFVRCFGLVEQTFTGTTPAVGQAVYLDHINSVPTLTVDTVRIGNICFASGSNYRFIFNGHATAV